MTEINNAGSERPARNRKYSAPPLPYKKAQDPNRMIIFCLKDANGKPMRHGLPYAALGQCNHVLTPEETVTADFYLAHEIVKATISGDHLDDIFDALTANTLTMVEKTPDEISKTEGKPTVADISFTLGTVDVPLKHDPIHYEEAKPNPDLWNGTSAFEKFKPTS